MREIKLVNNEGEEFDLTRPDACLQDISGIGMEIEFETVRIGQCDVVVDEQPQYNPVSGMIPFMDMEPYTEFLQFIAKRPITLAYKPKNAWYFTSVRVSVVEKEEITPVDEYAETNVDFYRLGPWYSTLRIDPYSDTTAAKRYTYTYPYRYVDSTAPGILLQNPSGQESPCTIEIYGPARNPRWELVKNGPEPQSVFLGDTPQGGTVDAPVELTGISSTVINKNLVTLPVPRPLRRVGAAQDKCSARVTSVYDKRIVLDGAEDWKMGGAVGDGAPYIFCDLLNDHYQAFPIISSRFPSTNILASNKNQGIGCWDRSLYLRYDSLFTNVEELKTYLSAHPLTVYYQSTAYDGTNGLDVCLMKYQTGFVELDGTEDVVFDTYGNTQKRIRFDLDRNAIARYALKFSHGNPGDTPTVTGGISASFNRDVLNRLQIICSPDTWTALGVTDTATAKTWLAAQKAAGTPIQVAYQLATPEICTTDPLDIQKAAGLSISSGAVATEIKEGQKLVVRSEADRLEIAIYTTENEWVEDVYQQSDFSTARFIYAPPGDSTLKFSHEGSQELNVSVEVRAYYEAV
ncbi:hypothetical protein HMPREF1032_00107 [Subdoligranulum sp. 4_3_54A2FAA]|nr:hypothetical protein HMPREF1032_00107 [Subdoligranulum sp. 4_3_54A2FAA]